MIQHSVQFSRKRRFLLFLPVLIVPLVTLLLWSMGLGRADGASDVPKLSGLNINLPSPKLADGRPTDKLSLYQAEEEDSIRFRRQKGYDSIYTTSDTPAQELKHDNLPARRGTSRSGLITGKSTEDLQEAAIRERLDALTRELNKAATPPPEDSSPLALPSANSMDIQRLEEMMRGLSTPVNDPADPQMEQVKGVLERIMDVQHPELVRRRLQEQSLKEKGRVLPVGTLVDSEVCETILPSRRSPLASDSLPATDTAHPSAVPVQTAASQPGGFFELDPASAEQQAANGISAVIHETRTLISGATVKLRLGQEVYVQGVRVPAGTFVFGDCKLEGERLLVNISAIRLGNSRFPVSLTVYDFDGLAGIPIRDAMTKQSTNQGADQALQSLQLYSMDPSISAQAASAGVETIKSLIRKKVKLVKATVKADYPVLLIDNSAGNR